MFLLTNLQLEEEYHRRPGGSPKGGALRRREGLGRKTCDQKYAAILSVFLVYFQLSGGEGPGAIARAQQRFLPLGPWILFCFKLEDA